jgi:thymidylate synthase
MNFATYEDLLQHVLERGEERTDRTGTGTLSIFGCQVKYDLRDSFPLITSKRVYWKGVVEELLWFLRGSTNNNELVERGVTIWNEWARHDGDLGPIYGKQWRKWSTPGRSKSSLSFQPIEAGAVDQIAWVIEEIKRNPMSRRLIVSAWNVGELEHMALHPCHVLFQFYVTSDRRLDCQLYQRSADIFLGVPFNVASYSLLTYMVARLTGLRPGVFTHTIGDAHIYLNHTSQAMEQLSREPRPFPGLAICGVQSSIDDFKSEHFKLLGYNPHPAISAPVAV